MARPHLVEGDNERGFVSLQQTDRFDGLWFESVHYIDDEDGQVATGRTPGTEVGERLVPGGVDDQEAGNFKRIALKLSKKTCESCASFCIMLVQDQIQNQSGLPASTTILSKDSDVKALQL